MVLLINLRHIPRNPRRLAYRLTSSCFLSCVKIYTSGLSCVLYIFTPVSLHSTGLPPYSRKGSATKGCLPVSWSWLCVWMIEYSNHVIRTCVRNLRFESIVCSYAWFKQKTTLLFWGPLSLGWEHVKKGQSNGPKKRPKTCLFPRLRGSQMHLQKSWKKQKGTCKSKTFSRIRGCVGLYLWLLGVYTCGYCVGSVCSTPG